jgi:alpha/beta superfamily hydrolase
MHNKVVHRLARGLRRAGCVVLRFNYRGVNLSEGAYGHMKGEAEDTRVALAELRSRYPQLPVLLGGFSFGSRVILHVAASDHNLSRTIAVGFPTKYPNSDFVREIRAPKFFIQSTHDAFGPREELQAFFDSLPEPNQVSGVEASEHFFRDNLDAYEAEVIRVGNLR